MHRGCVLGALLGAQVGLSGIPAPLVVGLVAHDELQEEVEAFAQLTCKEAAVEGASTAGL